MSEKIETVSMSWDQKEKTLSNMKVNLNYMRSHLDKQKNKLEKKLKKVIEQIQLHESVWDNVDRLHIDAMNEKTKR